MSQEQVLTGTHLVNARTAAGYLAISMRTLHRLVKKGQLPQPIHIGRSSRWRVRDLLNVIYQGSHEKQSS